MCIKSEHLQVIEETPTVRLRNKKKEDISKYLEHRQSANFSSSGHPVRPPRRQKQSDYGYSSLSRQAMDRNYSDRQYNSLR